MAIGVHSSSIEREIAALVGADAVLPGDTRTYRCDATESRGVTGTADAIALPADADQVAAVLAWCYERGVPVVPRGGGTGFSGGCVPRHGGVVVSLERLRALHSFDPELWRMHVGAGWTTHQVRQLARDHGLLFPPDPGAAEQSQIGGNIATNAGGPHAFKYGVTGQWVTGLEVVVPPGDVIHVGGAVRKDVAGFDLRGLMVGSEGTLGIITAAWLRLVPAPEAAMPVAACFASTAEGCAAIAHLVGSGLQVAALEYLDHGSLQAAGRSFPVELPASARFMVLCDADGSAEAAGQLRREVIDALSPTAVCLHAPEVGDDIAWLWRWREGVSHAVEAQRGGKVSEDIAVPVDQLERAIEGTLEIATRHGLEGLSWGHAGDGNLHSTFLVDPGSAPELQRAQAASAELFQLAVELGGTVSGEHGLGSVKAPYLALQTDPGSARLTEGIKRLFDPRGLLNPGTKIVQPTG